VAKPRGCLWQWLQIYGSGGFQALLTVLASGQNPLLSDRFGDIVIVVAMVSLFFFREAIVELNCGDDAECGQNARVVKIMVEYVNFNADIMALISSRGAKIAVIFLKVWLGRSVIGHKSEWKRLSFESV